MFQQNALKFAIFHVGIRKPTYLVFVVFHFMQLYIFSLWSLFLLKLLIEYKLLISEECVSVINFDYFLLGTFFLPEDWCDEGWNQGSCIDREIKNGKKCLQLSLLFWQFELISTKSCDTRFNTTCTNSN